MPWVAAGSKYGYELAMEWINSKEEHVAACGWSTLSSVVAMKPDSELDIPSLKSLLARIAKNIHTSENRVRSKMNGFIIAVGSYVVPLTNEAIATSKKIGDVTVDTDGTACKVPDASVYINKTKERGSLGKKKKIVKC